MNSARRPSSTEIEWPQVHARLAQAIARTHEVFNPSPERGERLLEERARRLARPLAAGHKAGDWLELLTFSLANERYGIETRHVQEVVRVAGLTAVPGVPDVVAGVANLRGQILVVFDIRPLFGLMPREPTQASRILVCGSAEADLGIIVDAVDDVVRLPVVDVLKDTIPENAAAESLIRGLTSDALIVLDGSALLNDRRLFVDQARRQ